MKEELIKFIKFNAVGLVNTAVDFLVFEVLVFAGVYYITAQVVSYVCGMLNSYLLNSRWTFRDKADTAGRVIAFALVNLVSLGVSIGVQALAQSTVTQSETIAKIISLPFSIGVNFLGNRLFVFRKKDGEK